MEKVEINPFLAKKIASGTINADKLNLYNYFDPSKSLNCSN